MIANATFTTVTFDTVTEDPYSGWNASTHEWMAPYTGWYEVIVGDNVTTAVDVQANVRVSGVTQYAVAQQQGALNANGVGGPIIVMLVGGEDTVASRIWVSPGATLDTATAGRYTSMEISFVSQ